MADHPAAAAAAGAGGGPPRYRTTPCESCGAPIIFAVLEGRRDKVPVDADPVAVNGGNGNVLLRARGEGVAPVARRVTNPAQLFGKRWVYRSHFDTCPFAARHRGTASRSQRRRRR